MPKAIRFMWDGELTGALVPDVDETHCPVCDEIRKIDNLVTCDGCRRRVCEPCIDTKPTAAYRACTDCVCKGIGLLLDGQIQTELERLANRAKVTGSRKDLQRYLQRRRMGIDPIDASGFQQQIEAAEKKAESLLRRLAEAESQLNKLKGE